MRRSSHDTAWTKIYTDRIKAVEDERDAAREVLRAVLNDIQALDEARVNFTDLSPRTVAAVRAALAPKEPM